MSGRQRHSTRGNHLKRTRTVATRADFDHFAHAQNKSGSLRRIHTYLESQLELAIYVHVKLLGAFPALVNGLCANQRARFEVPDQINSNSS